MWHPFYHYIITEQRACVPAVQKNKLWQQCLLQSKDCIARCQAREWETRLTSAPAWSLRLRLLKGEEQRSWGHCLVMFLWPFLVVVLASVLSWFTVLWPVTQESVSSSYPGEGTWVCMLMIISATAILVAWLWLFSVQLAQDWGQRRHKRESIFR